MKAFHDAVTLPGESVGDARVLTLKRFTNEERLGVQIKIRQAATLMWCSLTLFFNSICLPSSILARDTPKTRVVRGDRSPMPRGA